MSTLASEKRAAVVDSVLPRWFQAALVTGDALAFLLFSDIGRFTHHEPSGLSAPGAVVLTALPFVIGWFVVSPWSGALRRSFIRRPVSMLLRTELTWVVAWPVAMLLRWLFDQQAGVPPLSFAIVALIMNGLFLGIWRTLFSLIVSKTSAR